MYKRRVQMKYAGGIMKRYLRYITRKITANGRRVQWLFSAKHMLDNNDNSVAAPVYEHLNVLERAIRKSNEYCKKSQLKEMVIIEGESCAKDLKAIKTMDKSLQHDKGMEG